MDTRFREYHKLSGYWGEPSGIRRLDYIISVAENHKKTLGTIPNILEVGCGNGNISITLACLGFKVAAIDIDEESITMARKNIRPGVKVDFQIKSVEELASEKGSNNYDILICTEVLEHLVDPRSAIKSFPRLMSEDGIAVITIPNGFCLEERIRHFLVMNPFGQRLRKIIKQRLIEKGHVQSSNISSSHIQYFSLATITQLLEKSGFHIVEIVNSSAFFREAYYLFFRLFMRRGSWLFRRLDDFDNYLASKIGKNFASGWFILCRRSQENRTNFLHL